MDRRTFILATIGFLVAGPVAVAVSAERNDLLPTVNRRRRARDRRALEPESGMNRRSQRHAERMAEAGYLFHSDVQLPEGAVWAGEVVGVGGSASSIVKAWLHSPEHRNIVLRRRADIAGAGSVASGDVLWTVVQVAELG